MTIQDWNPESIAVHYSKFRVTERILLTGHSHQAWPDVAFDGQQQAWLDAAEFVDSKWSLAFEQAHKVKLFFADLLGESSANNYTLAASTHDLLIRFLSALDWKQRKRIITTDGEFHSMRRQLGRLIEAGIDVIRVPVEPAETLTERISNELDQHTLAVMMSAVMFKDSAIIPNLNIIGESCGSREIPLLVDVYHALNVLPFTLEQNGLEQAFIVGGGYKYCQFGEGNCFLRIPDNNQSRPVITGWYAEFSELEGTLSANATLYPTGGDRFQGSTYDPTSHYRAASVINFFNQQNFTPRVLRQISQHQIGLLRDAFDALDADPNIIVRTNVALDSVAGFLSLKTDAAPRIQSALKECDIWTDQRDGYLRLGPAPYVSDRQLTDAIIALAELL